MMEPIKRWFEPGLGAQVAGLSGSGAAMWQIHVKAPGRMGNAAPDL
jgi:hypothetical protein